MSAAEGFLSAGADCSLLYAPGPGTCETRDARRECESRRSRARAVCEARSHELCLDAIRRVAAHALAAKTLQPSATPRSARAETEALSVAGAHSLTPSAASLTNAGVVFLISLCAVSTEVCSIWWERRRPRAAAACIRFWR